MLRQRKHHGISKADHLRHNRAQSRVVKPSKTPHRSLAAFIRPEASVVANGRDFAIPQKYKNTIAILANGINQDHINASMHDNQLPYLRSLTSLDFSFDKTLPNQVSLDNNNDDTYNISPSSSSSRMGNFFKPKGHIGVCAGAFPTLPMPNALSIVTGTTPKNTGIPSSSYIPSSSTSQSTSQSSSSQQNDITDNNHHIDDSTTPSKKNNNNIITASPTSHHTSSQSILDLISEHFKKLSYDYRRNKHIKPSYTLPSINIHIYSDDVEQKRYLSYKLNEINRQHSTEGIVMDIKYNDYSVAVPPSNVSIYIHDLPHVPHYKHPNMQTNTPPSISSSESSLSISSSSSPPLPSSPTSSSQLSNDTPPQPYQSIKLHDLTIDQSPALNLGLKGYIEALHQQYNEIQLNNIHKHENDNKKQMKHDEKIHSDKNLKNQYFPDNSHRIIHYNGTDINTVDMGTEYNMYLISTHYQLGQFQPGSVQSREYMTYLDTMIHLFDTATHNTPIPDICIHTNNKNSSPSTPSSPSSSSLASLSSLSSSSSSSSLSSSPSSTSSSSSSFLSPSPSSLLFPNNNSYFKVDLSRHHNPDTIVGVTSTHTYNDKTISYGGTRTIYISDILYTLNIPHDIIIPVNNTYNPLELVSYASVLIHNKNHIDIAMKYIRNLRGCYTVLPALDAAKAFDLPSDKLGDFIVIGDINSTFGTTRQYHENLYYKYMKQCNIHNYPKPRQLEVISMDNNDNDKNLINNHLYTIPYPLRTSGSMEETTLPIIISRPLNSRYSQKLNSGKSRNFDIYDYLLNGIY